VELVNLRFQVPATQRSPVQALVGGHGAQLTLVNVYLQGVLTIAEALESLLYWSDENNPQARLVCRDCTFVGSGRALKLKLGPADALLRHCLIVSRGDALDLALPALEPGASAGALSADHVTISATLGAIHLQTDSVDENSAAHRFYFDQCVFAAPLAKRANESFGPTLFRLARPQNDLKAVEWWGTSNGVSPEIATLIRGDKDHGDADAQAGLARWREVWNAEQDAQFLTGPGGVVLNEPNPKANVIKPEQFQLHPSSKAAHWGDGETPIGVDIPRLAAPVATAKPKEASKSAPKKPGPALPNF
jgi:hypothetical protein